MSATSKQALAIVALAILVGMGSAFMQVQTAPGVTGTGPASGGSGTVSANSGSAGAIADYAAAGGSTTVGPDTLLTDSGTVLTYTGTGGMSAPQFVSTVAIGTAPFTVTSTTNVINLNASTLGGATFAAPGGIGTTTPGIVKASQFKLVNIVDSSTAPTISSGFGTSPSVVASNGTAAFTINVGTGGVATSGVIGLPAATTGWSCQATDLTTTSTTVFLTKQTATSTTTATIGNFNTSAAAAAWVASDVLSVHCFAY